MPNIPGALDCVDAIGPGATPADVEAVCQVVAALEMADPGELPAASWARLAAEAAAKLSPANPSRVLLVEQILESAWSDSVRSAASAASAASVASAASHPKPPLPVPLAASVHLVRDTAVALAKSDKHRRKLSTVAFVAAAAKLLGGRRLASSAASLLDRGGQPLDCRDCRDCRALRRWEREAIASAVGQLATDEFACASLAALRLAVTSSSAFLLREISSASPRLASALRRMPADKRAACADAVCWSASTLYLSGDSSATRQVCCLLTLARTAVSDRGSCCSSGQSPPKLHNKSAVRALACIRLREQVAARNARDASLSAVVLQQIRCLDGSRDDRLTEAGCDREAAMWTDAVELAASLVASPSRDAPPRGDCLASLCAGYVMGLVCGSPLFASRAGSGLGRALWSLAAVLRLEAHRSIAENVAESLFFIHAWDDDGDGDANANAAWGPAMFAAHLRRDAPATLLIPFARSCCRLATERGHKQLAADACSALSRILRGGDSKISTNDACKSLACLRPGWTPVVPAAELARAVVAAMDPGPGSEAPARLFERLAPWIQVMDEPAAVRVTDVACEAIATSAATCDTRLMRAAVRCLAARPLPKHRASLESAMEKALTGCPEIFPDIVAALAFTFGSASDAGASDWTPASSAAELTRRAVDRVVGAAESTNRIGDDARNAAWWARVVIDRI